MLMNTEQAIDLLRKEIHRARFKFPQNDRLFEALGEEVGELGRAFTGDGDIREEAIQVACVAIRIASEGTTLPNGMTLWASWSLERICRGLLEGQKERGEAV